jgi:CDP-6-deoxy-D-xylo-4-hexulose-3-dehydrase
MTQASLKKDTEQKREDFLYVPYGQTVHGEEEINAVLHVLRTSTQMGKHVREMEANIASSFDKKYGVMVNSGSSALYLAIESLDLPKGSEVITPALTFSTTVACLVKNGLVPAFVDCEADTYCIDVNKIEAAITPNTSAMCIPNLLGNMPEWEKINKIAQKHNLKVIEDSADTVGGEYNGVSSGAYSDISITSFYGSHVINCAGNGGILCMNEEKIANKAKLLRSWGRSSSLFVESEAIENRFDISIEGIEYDKKFVFEDIGYNLEPSEMGAAFGLVQFKKLQSNIDKRIDNFNKQTEFFKQYPQYFILPRQCANTRTGWLAYPILIKEDAPFTRRELQIFLEKRNIQTRVVFTGNILRQPGFKNITCKGKADDFTQADRVMKRGILFACHHGLTPQMIEHIQSSVKLFVESYA